MIKLLILSVLSLALLGCHGTPTQPKAKFEEPEREQCYRKCLVSYKGTAESAYKKCFRTASKYQEGRSCFGGHGS
ncbi:MULTISPECIES: hypothetical protein [unclassified Acinetobacter]|uniref:hypothetical protein n=1 Tax=unclassified Acinetobacter TaxID=196816 RepID=UPI002578AB2C|nr:MULTISPECIES: hypothetical protein [unclassified Acinetobacter]MDM1245796.1 hypothetical protein [Acinetobacter sp. R933-2]MDM1763826.1 hypothetical protein [Acinetobacter sp. 226-1]MDM1767560.1 hypothetical protein [Acinetobacter sp. 226-4]